jgi:hypothetical protein
MGVAIFLMTMMVIDMFCMIKMAVDPMTPTTATFKMNFLINMTTTGR